MKSITKFFMVTLLGLALCSFTQVSESAASYDQVTSLETALDFAVAKSFSEAASSSTTSDKGTWSTYYRVWTLNNTFGDLDDVQSAIAAIEVH